MLTLEGFEPPTPLKVYNIPSYRLLAFLPITDRSATVLIFENCFAVYYYSVILDNLVLASHSDASTEKVRAQHFCEHFGERCEAAHNVLA